jgi:hypothetical protein
MKAEACGLYVSVFPRNGFRATSFRPARGRRHGVVVRKHIETSSLHLPEGRDAAARLRITPVAERPRPNGLFFRPQIAAPLLLIG